MTKIWWAKTFPHAMSLEELKKWAREVQPAMRKIQKRMMNEKAQATPQKSNEER